MNGYQHATLPDGRIIGILHGTCVCLVRPDKLYVTIWFNTGGFHTRSTVKAINATLDYAGIHWYSARIKDETVVVQRQGSSILNQVNDTFEVDVW